MPRKKKEPKPKPTLKAILDPEWKAWLHNTEEGQQRLLEAQAFYFQKAAEHHAEAMPEGEEKQKLLRLLLRLALEIDYTHLSSHDYFLFNSGSVPRYSFK